MKTTYLAIIVTFLVTMMNPGNLQALAQTNLPGSKITGNVIDEQNKPLEFATIILTRAADSVMVKTSMTDLTGKYLFENIPAGQYITTANMTGYKKVRSKAFTLDITNSQVTIDPLQTAINVKLLKEVNIVAQKPFIERKMDKLIVNVENRSVSACH